MMRWRASQRAVTLLWRRITRTLLLLPSLLFVCLGLSLDCGQNAFSFGWALPSTSLISWVALCYLYCLCFVNCEKFGELILAKIIKTVVTRYQILRLKCTKFDIGWGSHLQPRSVCRTPSKRQTDEKTNGHNGHVRFLFACFTLRWSLTLSKNILLWV